MDSDTKFLKFSIIISFILIVVCSFFVIYDGFIVESDDLALWLILGLSNVVMIITNVDKYKKLKK